MSGLHDSDQFVRLAEPSAPEAHDRAGVRVDSTEQDTCVSPERIGRLLQWGSVDYGKAWTYQHRLVEARRRGHAADTLILLEHEPVVTLGRTARDSHWRGAIDELRQRGIGVYQVERGGSATYHGPGQIVGYPILQLKTYSPGPKRYVEMLEEVIIRVLAEWAIVGHRVKQWRGVWVEDERHTFRKIASVGVRIASGVTMHGFALNVSMDLAPFNLIIPCGLEGIRVTSMAEVLGHEVSIEEVKAQIAQHFGAVFGLRWIP